MFRLIFITLAVIVAISVAILFEGSIAAIMAFVAFVLAIDGVAKDIVISALLKNNKNLFDSVVTPLEDKNDREAE
jgi:hypothetical protein